MVLGTQWYILFNVIAGAPRCRGNCATSATNFGIKGWLWWRKVALPAVFPFYVTGAITASGGSWNASIVAEVANWGTRTLHAARPRRLYRRRDDGGRFPSHRPRHGGDELLCGGHQSAVLAAALWYAERRYRLT